MSIKGKGETLFVGKQKITIREFWEKDTIFFYDDIRSIEYQFHDNSKYGFMRFKLTDGSTKIFTFGKKSNEPMSRAVEYINERIPEKVASEVHEKFGFNEKFALYSLKKKIAPFILSFLVLFISIYFYMESFTTGNDMYITLEEYNKCAIGMTYDDCVKIIGSEGTPLSESEIVDINSTAYLWYGDNFSGSNANFYFMNNKLYSKSQFGLN